MKLHIPVLVNEVLEGLDIKPNENVIDGTIGQGGHSAEFLKKNSPAGKVLGIDKDALQIENARIRLAEFSERLILVNDSYANIKKIVLENNFIPSAILVDLGYSSWQIEDDKRGFSFLKNAPLDMRYNSQQEMTAEKIIQQYSEQALEDILEKYGEEKYARQIAREIVSVREKKKITTTFDLNEIIARALPKKYQHERIHYATRTYQALRIAVNQELVALEQFLPEAISVLKSGGRLGVISFHSLEDRIVKQLFNQLAQEGVVKIITKKPIVESREQLRENPRARSAKLRILMKI